MQPISRQNISCIPVTIICINTVTDWSLRSGGYSVDDIPVRLIGGELCNGCFSERIPFYGFHDLILKLEAIYDALDFPQRSTETRSFWGNKIARYVKLSEEILPPLRQRWNECVMQSCHGKRATLSVHVYARQNGSWQGAAWWLDKSRSKQFRSVLELCRLIESALDEQMTETLDRETEKHGGTET